MSRVSPVRRIYLLYSLICHSRSFPGKVLTLEQIFHIYQDHSFLSLSILPNNTFLQLHERTTREDSQSCVSLTQVYHLSTPFVRPQENFSQSFVFGRSSCLHTFSIKIRPCFSGVLFMVGIGIRRNRDRRDGPFS